tara:strand:+ start:17020 stop:17190 length:171 start_codon:yes stop_codon:yes gene_type:complete
MWNISFKIYRDGILYEEGFETSTAHDISHALQEADTILDLDGCDRIELIINRISFK